MVKSTQSLDAQNPFTVITPEKLDARTAEQLFVEVFSDFPQVENPGHALIWGARGSGKSMMFRCLLPDVLVIRKGCCFAELPFLAFHISIKNTQLRITDLERLDSQHATYLINEHFFTITLFLEVLESLSKLANQVSLPFEKDEYKKFQSTLFRLERNNGMKGINSFEFSSPEEFFWQCKIQIDELLAEFLRYVVKLSFANPPSYDLPLFSFLGFLVPILKSIKELPGFAKVNIYLLIDDADNLSKTQTRVLNGWLASRVQPEISLKVSCQLKKYKSFLAPNNTSVESPHDFQEVNISDIYTTSRNVYFKRINDVIQKRLTLKNISTKVIDYFPPNVKQERLIEEEANRLREIWSTEGTGNRPSDDALRYARPNYIRDLGGTRKARHTYSYSGFGQLVHLSSGVIRNFLDSAALMFDETIKEADRDQALAFIPHRIQNRISRDQADTFIFTQFERRELDEEPIKGKLGVVQKLQNLIFSMGFTFHDILVSDRSERRVFSIALTNIPTTEIKEVLDFGVQENYLHESSIGNKEGTGRTWLYILNRYLAPHFTLDPTSFAGYIFVTNEALIDAMYLGKRLREMDAVDDIQQLTLFE
jgi:hypothetical protein